MRSVALRLGAHFLRLAAKLGRAGVRRFGLGGIAAVRRAAAWVALAGGPRLSLRRAFLRPRFAISRRPRPTGSLPRARRRGGGNLRLAGGLNLFHPMMAEEILQQEGDQVIRIGSLAELPRERQQPFVHASCSAL